LIPFKNENNLQKMIPYFKYKGNWDAVLDVSGTDFAIEVQQENGHLVVGYHGDRVRGGGATVREHPPRARDVHDKKQPSEGAYEARKMVARLPAFC